MIRIFGCGVSGLVAGLELHKAGMKQAVTGVRNFYRKGYECQGIVPVKGKADIFARKGVSPSEYGIKPNTVVKKMLFHFNNEEREIRFPIEVYIRGMHPESLDSKLWDMYRETGNVVEEKVFDQKDLKGKTVVVADGFRSTICGWLGINRADKIGGAILCTARGNFDTGTGYLSLDKDLSGHGYSYVLPISPKEATVSTCLPEPTHLPERLEKFKKEVMKTMDIKSFSKPHTGFGKWVTEKVPYMQKNGMEYYIIGDAASTMEPLGGFGMSNAIATAISSAKAIVAGDPAVYQRVFREIEKTNSQNLKMRRMMERFGINSLTEKLIMKFVGARVF